MKKTPAKRGRPSKADLLRRQQEQPVSKGEQLRRNQELAGIPDSKPFVAPESERPKGNEDRMLKCHIAGVEISKMGLEPHVLSCLDYYATDEGIAERNAEPNRREPSGIKLGRDEFSKSLDQRRDDVIDRGMQPYQARNMLKEVADKHARPGMRPKFLDAQRVKENGNAGDYEIVRDGEGKEVRVRNLILGHMPEEMAVARNKFYRDKGNQMVKQITKRYKAEGGKTAVADSDSE